MVFLNYNPDEVPNEYEPIPAGIYPAQIIKEEEKVTKGDNGYPYVSWQIQIIDGEKKGRILFLNLFILTDEKSKPFSTQGGFSMSNEHVKSAMKAVNHVGEFTDTLVLLNRPLAIRVVVKDRGEYGPQNEIKEFLPLSQARTNEQASTGDKVPPWRNR